MPVSTQQGPSVVEADRDAMARIGLRAFTRVAEAWRLPNGAAAALIDVSDRTWTRMKNGAWSGALSQDKLMRLSALIGLYKGLHLYFSDALADQWVTMPNKGPLFGGRAPIDVMKDAGLPAIIDVRNYIDALRGGV